MFPVDIEKPSAGEEGQGGRGRFFSPFLFEIKPAQSTRGEWWDYKTLVFTLLLTKVEKRLWDFPAEGNLQLHLGHKEQQKLPWAPPDSAKENFPSPGVKFIMVPCRKNRIEFNNNLIVLDRYEYRGGWGGELVRLLLGFFAKHEVFWKNEGGKVRKFTSDYKIKHSHRGICHINN